MNYKGQLKEFVDANPTIPNPKYVTVRTSLATEPPLHHCSLLFDSHRFFGNGTTKKQAEQLASKDALHWLDSKSSEEEFLTSSEEEIFPTSSEEADRIVILELTKKGARYYEHKGQTIALLNGFLLKDSKPNLDRHINVLSNKDELINNIFYWIGVHKDKKIILHSWTFLNSPGLQKSLEQLPCNVKIV